MSKFDYIWDYEQPTKKGYKDHSKELRRKLGKRRDQKFIRRGLPL